MKYDKDKVDEMVLALLFLTTSEDEFAARAWKGLDWEAMNRLFARGYISDPSGKSPTIVLSAAGEKLSKELFVKHFAVKK